MNLYLFFCDTTKEEIEDHFREYIKENIAELARDLEAEIEEIKLS